jgi:hypothetical protein
MAFRTTRRSGRREPQVVFCDGEGAVCVRDVGSRLTRVRDRVMASSWPTGR